MQTDSEMPWEEAPPEINGAQKAKHQHWQASRGINDLEAAPIMEFDEISEDELAQHLSMAYAPEPDLFIRTGGEERISNFLLWQLAYTEFHFTQELWPDFGRESLLKAIDSYRRRERRFGRTSEQLVPPKATANAKVA